MQQIEILKGELTMERSSRESSLNERIHKIELNSQRGLDEVFGYNEQIRLLQEERKRDI